MATHTCRRCGAAAEAPADGVPLAWSITTADSTVWLLCDRCTREHARDIEGKLDEQWWA